MKDIRVMCKCESYEEDLSECCLAPKRVLIPLQIGGFDRIECSVCGKIFIPRKNKKSVNPRFIETYGKYGLQIGRIFTNKNRIGIRFWFPFKNKIVGLEKSIYIKLYD